MTSVQNWKHLTPNTHNTDTLLKKDLTQEMTRGSKSVTYLHTATTSTIQNYCRHTNYTSATCGFAAAISFGAMKNFCISCFSFTDTWTTFTPKYRRQRS